MANKSKPSNYVDLTGEKYGRFTVLERVGTDKHGRPTWKCECECGNIKIISSRELRSGNTKSCGCLRRDLVTNGNVTHGKSKTRIYKIWAKMLERTVCETCKEYAAYGAVGIGVCDRWRNFEAFYEDMKDGYADDLSIDRIDNSKGYSADNCRWATDKQQANNKTNNVRIELDGVTKTIAEWSEVFGINSSTAYHRHARGVRGKEIFAPCSEVEIWQERKGQTGSAQT